MSSHEKLQKVLKCRDSIPSLATVVVLDADAADRGVLPFEKVLERADEVSGRNARSAARRGADRRACDGDVHVGDDRDAEGHLLLAPQHGLQALRPRAGAAGDRRGRRVPLLPAALPHVRPLPRDARLRLLGRHVLLRAEPVDRDARGRDAGSATVDLHQRPKKWMQLYEGSGRRSTWSRPTTRRSRAAVRLTAAAGCGGASRPRATSIPEIFRFFQRHGVELMSGFGMTEATGGITMTPPGRYRDDSLGLALPGIELALADDGELVVRGPYVMMGYLGEGGLEPALDADGWFHTGDLFEMDADGHVRLVDRKKEIYKNVKGETIAPQRIENLFRDFESVGRVFLVGDHRPYNTALI